LVSGGVYTPLDVPGSISTDAYGINNSGQIVGEYRDAQYKAHGFLLSDGIYIPLDFPGSTFTYAAGINDSGQIVGRYVAGGTNAHGFLATPSNPEPATLILVGVSTLGFIGYAWRAKGDRRRREYHRAVTSSCRPPP
jgi:probable HAF family extracellular repeat protein